ncbi:hypothetical protein DL93DRAFT_2162403 [Clavulina sp. PMI_390]|nr:hypothetical protein DL93DRAFT_2162403 [Clavulina sp. PMI_390]
MSLLRSVLKKGGSSSPDSPNKPFDPLKAGGPKAKSKSSSAQSFKSVASTIKSISSFYSAITGNGVKVPKRRRPPVLTFGAPTFYHSDPPPASTVPGVERVPLGLSSALPFTAAHAASLYPDNTRTDATTSTSGDSETGVNGSEPWLSIVLFSHGNGSDPKAIYHDQATVTGEVRMILSKPRNIESVDVWLVGKMDCVLEIQGVPFIQQRARVWGSGSSFTGGSKKKFAAGTHVFPFTFTPLSQDTKIHQPEEAQRKNKGDVRLDLPPSISISAVGNFAGEIHYTVGVNIAYGSMWDIDDSLDLKIGFLPRTRPLLREPTLFPLLPTREDWPFEQEIVAGWMLLPFGGRGRFVDDMIEVEGILGVPYPPVYTPDDTVPFKLILWSESTSQLAQLAQPSSIQVVLVKNDVYGPDALVPRSAARKNRRSVVVGSGKIWRDDQERNTPAAPTPTSPPKPKRRASTGLSLESIDEDEEKEEEAPLEAEVPLPLAQDEEVSVTPKSEPPAEEAASQDILPQTAITTPIPPSESVGAEPSTSVSTSPLRATPPLSSLSIGPASSGLGPRGALARLNGVSSSAKPPSRMSPPSSPSKAPVPSRWASFTADSDSEDENEGEENGDKAETSQPPESDTDTSTILGDGGDDETAAGAPASPPSTVGDVTEADAEQSSFAADEEEWFPGMEDDEKIITLSGSIPLKGALGRPSFNYKYMSRHYMAKIIITHKEYNHITPSATGIYAEAPIWVTTDPPAAVLEAAKAAVESKEKLNALLSEAPASAAAAAPISNTSSPPVSPTSTSGAAPPESMSPNYSALPIAGAVVPVPGSAADVTRYPSARGVHSDKERPSWKATRVAAF